MSRPASISAKPPWAWLRQFGLGFGYWLTVLLVLEPGNILGSRGTLAWDQETIRILGASLLGAAATPLVLTLVRRLPVEGPRPWRRAGLHLASHVGLAFGLILASCLLAGWWLTSEHRPLARALPDELAANLALLIFCLSVLSGLAHAARFLGQARPAPSALEPIPIKTRGGVRLLDPGEIDWIESQGNYQALHCGPETHLVRETSQRLEARLDPARFVRIHRRTLVARDRIIGVRRLAAGDALLQLRDGPELRLSRGFRGGIELLGR